MCRHSLAVLVCFGALELAAAPNASSAKPNIVFILADDLGIDGIGCYGTSVHKTPNIDRLAANGMRFDACFAEPLCAPSRALLMSGQYPFRTGVISNQWGRMLDPSKHVSIAKMLNNAGYATAVAGKWPQLEYLKTPEEGCVWGWNEFMIWDGHGTPDRYWKPRFTKNGQQVAGDERQYGPDLLHEFCIDFMRRHRDRPFFLYYPMVLVHAPIVRTPDTDTQAKDEDLFADNTAYMDKLVGKLVAELDSLGIAKNTLLIYCGDNGTPAKYQHEVGGRKLSGGKNTLTDGGSRVPFVAHWPGVVPAGRAVADMISFADVYPTCAELAGAEMPSGVTFDGQSMVWQLKGQSGTPRQWVYVELGRGRYVRDAAWKLNNDRQLFDMRDAPFVEKLVDRDTTDAEAIAARKRLETALVKLVGKELAFNGSAPPAKK